MSASRRGGSPSMTLTSIDVRQNNLGITHGTDSAEIDIAQGNCVELDRAPSVASTSLASLSTFLAGLTTIRGLTSTSGMT